MLKQVGAVLHEESAKIKIAPSGFETVLHNPNRLTAGMIRGAKQFLQREQIKWNEAHRITRARVRGMLAQHGQRDPWGSIASFLDEQWTTVDMLGSMIESMWAVSRIPGTPDIQLVLVNEVWRLLFEGIGATVYERCVPGQTLPPAHAADVAQLVYLADRTQRVFVTGDNALLRVAKAVLERRYGGSRVLSPEEFLALS
jgi:hypothetical protein